MWLIKSATHSYAWPFHIRLIHTCGPFICVTWLHNTCRISIICVTHWYVTHSHVWPIQRWLIHTCDPFICASFTRVTYSNVWHDLMMRFQYPATWLIHTCYSLLCDSFICVTHIMCDLTRLYVLNNMSHDLFIHDSFVHHSYIHDSFIHDSFIRDSFIYDSFICVTHMMCDLTRWYVLNNSYTTDTCPTTYFIRVTHSEVTHPHVCPIHKWLIHMCDIFICVTWLHDTCPITCDMTHSCVWPIHMWLIHMCGPFICVSLTCVIHSCV